MSREENLLRYSRAVKVHTLDVTTTAQTVEIDPTAGMLNIVNTSQTGVTIGIRFSEATVFESVTPCDMLNNGKRHLALGPGSATPPIPDGCKFMSIAGDGSAKVYIDQFIL